MAGLGYNLVFTACPILVVAIFDQDVPEDAPIRFPEIYKPLQNNIYVMVISVEFTHLVQLAFIHLLDPFGSYSLPGKFRNSPYDGLQILFFIPVYCYQHQSGGFWVLSTVVYSSAIVLVNVKIGLQSKWTIFQCC